MEEYVRTAAVQSLVCISISFICSTVDGLVDEEVRYEAACLGHTFVFWNEFVSISTLSGSSSYSYNPRPYVGSVYVVCFENLFVGRSNSSTSFILKKFHEKNILPVNVLGSDL